MQARKVILIAIGIAVVIGGVLFFRPTTAPKVKTDDREKFSSTVEHFNILEEVALEAMRVRDTTTKEIFLSNLKETALSSWADCVNVLDVAEKMDLPTNMENYRLHLIDYSNHRLQQTLLLIKASQEDTKKYQGSIDSVQKKINAVKEIIKKEKKAINF